LAFGKYFAFGHLLEGQTFWPRPLKGAFQNHPPAIQSDPVAILERQTLGIDNEAANIARQSAN
jgi:hypothetical protein